MKVQGSYQQNCEKINKSTGELSEFFFKIMSSTGELLEMFLKIIGSILQEKRERKIKRISTHYKMSCLRAIQL